MRVATGRRRRGGLTIWLFLLIIPLFGLVAFAVDLNYVWTVDAQLQNAADAAALAGATQLLTPNLLASLPATGPVEWYAYEQQAEQGAVRAAQARAATETAAGAPVVVNAADVQVGYIQDPTFPPDTAAGRLQPPSGGNFPNSVQVTVRLDNSVPAGPLQLLFAPIIGTSSVVRAASATATLRGQNVSGFSGSGSRLLPIAMSLTAGLSLLGTPTIPVPAPGLPPPVGPGPGAPKPLGPVTPPLPPLGITVKDTFTVTLPIAGGGQAPFNVSVGQDNIPEAHVRPALTNPGDFYTVSLCNAPVTSDPAYVSWILNGPTASDLASFGPNGLQASLLAPAAMYAGPNLDPAMDTALKSVVGQTRIVPIFTTYTQGATPKYQVVGFMGATVVSVNLLGPKPHLTLQPTATLDPSAQLGGGGLGGTAVSVYQRISLSR